MTYLSKSFYGTLFFQLKKDPGKEFLDLPLLSGRAIDFFNLMIRYDKS